MNQKKLFLILLIIVVELIVNPLSLLAGSVEMSHMGIAVYENGVKVSEKKYSNSEDGEINSTDGVLFTQMLSPNEELQFDYPYIEELNIKNVGEMDAYCRVIINKYWIDEQERKFLNDNSSFTNLIELELNVGNDWKIDDDATTEERTVLYYQGIVNVGSITSNFLNSVSISSDIYNYYEETNQNGIITRTYLADGKKLVVEYSAEFVQTHNAREAIYSAWGVSCDKVGLNP